MTAEIAPWLTDSRWPTVPIRYLARLGTGHTPSRQHSEYWQDCTIPWVTLADVGQLRDGTVDVITRTAEKISRLGMANSAAVRHPAGTVILSRTASVGFSAILGADMATSQDFATWTCGSQLERKYLLHALRAMAPDLRRLAMGSTHKTIYMPDIAQLRIPVPPLAEQRRVSQFLDVHIGRIDALRRNRVDQVRLLLERWNAHLSEVMSAISEANGRIALRRVVDRIEQGWSPECEDREAASDEWAVLKTSAVSSGKFDPLAHKTLPPSIRPDLRYELRDGDLLLTRGSGSRRLVGMAAVVHTEGRKLLLSDLLYRLHLPAACSPEYVAFALRGQQVRQHLLAMTRGAPGLTAKLRSEDILGTEIPALPARDQVAISETLKLVEANCLRLVGQINRSVALLDERRQALITAAVTGQFDVTTVRGVDLS